MKIAKERNWKQLVHSTILITAMCSSAAAQAVTIAGGPVYGGPGSVGGFINCRFFNYGNTPVSVTVHRIFTNTNVAVTPSFDACNTVLGAGKYCAYGAPITGNFAYSCRAQLTGTDTRVSGVAEIQASNFSVINNVPLQR